MFIFFLTFCCFIPQNFIALVNFCSLQNSIGWFEDAIYLTLISNRITSLNNIFLIHIPRNLALHSVFFVEFIPQLLLITSFSLFDLYLYSPYIHLGLTLSDQQRSLSLLN